MTGFAFDIKKFEEAALLAMNNNLCRDAEELFSEIVTLSPNPPDNSHRGYSQGLIKNSWFIDASGNIDPTVGSVANPTGADSLSRMKAALTTLPFYAKDGAVTFTNSLPYIEFVEYIGWPKDYPGNDTGWDWTGKGKAYAMVTTSVTNFKAKRA